MVQRGVTYVADVPMQLFLLNIQRLVHYGISFKSSLCDKKDMQIYIHPTAPNTTFHRVSINRPHERRRSFNAAPTPARLHAPNPDYALEIVRHTAEDSTRRLPYSRCWCWSTSPSPSRYGAASPRDGSSLTFAKQSMAPSRV